MPEQRKQELKRMREEYLRDFNQLSLEDQRPHFSFVLGLIIRKLEGSPRGPKVEQPCGGLTLQ